MSLAFGSYSGPWADGGGQAYRGSRGGRGRRGRGRGRASVVPPRLPDVASVRAPVSPTACVAWLAVRRYTTSAEWIGPSFSSLPMWQAVLVHLGESSLVSQSLDALRDFLRARAITRPGTPADLAALRTFSAIMVQVGANRDLAGLGVSNEALAFYVEGDERALENMMALIHEFLEFRLAPDGEFTVTSSPSLLLHVYTAEELNVSHVVERFTAVSVRYTRTAELPVDVFAAPPPAICDSPLLQLEFANGDTELQGTLSGYTYPFRRELQRNRLFGSYYAQTGEFMRVWPRCEIDEHGTAVAFDDLYARCLFNAPLRIVLASVPPVGSRAHLFVQRLRRCPTLSVRLPHHTHAPFDRDDLVAAAQTRADAANASTTGVVSSAALPAAVSTDVSLATADVVPTQAGIMSEVAMASVAPVAGAASSDADPPVRDRSRSR